MDILVCPLLEDDAVYNVYDIFNSIKIYSLLHLNSIFRNVKRDKGGEEYNFKLCINVNPYPLFWDGRNPELYKQGMTIAEIASSDIVLFVSKTTKNYECSDLKRICEIHNIPHVGIGILNQTKSNISLPNVIIVKEYRGTFITKNETGCKKEMFLSDIYKWTP